MTSDSDPIEVWLVSGSHQRAPQPASAAAAPASRLSGGQAAVKPEQDAGMPPPTPLRGFYQVVACSVVS